MREKIIKITYRKCQGYNLKKQETKKLNQKIKKMKLQQQMKVQKMKNYLKIHKI